MQPDYNKSLEFLRRFHPNRRWLLTSISLDKRQINTRTFDEGRSAQCLQWLQLQGFDKNIYYSVAEIDLDLDKKAERTDLINVWWLHVDLDPRAGEDIPTERERILKVLRNPSGLLPPTCIVYSGGGYQGFWKLNNPIPINNKLDLAEEAALYNLQIEVALGADSVHDVSRIMRLPGTINRPDAGKIKKGRTPALAEVVEWNDERVYNIEQFTKSPKVQISAPGMAGGASKNSPPVQVSGNIKRLDSVDELGDKVSLRAKVIICQGMDPDEPTKFSGRSEWLFHVCCEMVRGGCSDEQIYAVITDPKFAISASVLDKGSMIEKYALRQIVRAKEEAIDPDLGGMNDQYAIIGNWSGKCRVVEEQYDEVMQRYRLTKQSFEDFKNRHMHQKKNVGTNGKGGPIFRGIGDWWLDHSNRRQFDKLLFAPGREVEGAYNLWRGFAVVAKPGDCSLFLNHLKENICQGNLEHYEYLVKWMARSVQKPDSPGHAGVVFRGGQGTGKSFVAKTLGSLFGRHYMQVTDPKHLVGSFNAHLRDCVVLFGDEAFYAGDKKHESILKMLVTEEMITIEAKGIDAEVSANCIHLMMASNESWVVPAGMDDRRFFVLQVGNSVKNDDKYFSTIVEQLDNGGREALLHHLLTLDLSGWNVRKVPKTVALQQQKLHSMDSTKSWWFEKLQDGRLLPEHTEWRTEIPMLDLMHDYISYCKQFNVSRRSTAFALREVMLAMLPEGYPQKYQTSTPIEVTMPDGLRRMHTRPYWFRLPTLDLCRKHWDGAMGAPFPWQTLKVETVEPEASVF